MAANYRQSLAALLAGKELSADAVKEALGAMLDGSWNEVQITAFLTALHVKGETYAELVAAASHIMAIRRRAELDAPETILDTAGTGGDGKGTFNISTAAAFVAAAAGVPVAKHGNRAQSGTCGSSEVLVELGARLELDQRQQQECFATAGICFMFAPLYHPALKQVAPVRSQIGMRTLFNLIGPLVNPAGAGLRLAGVFDPAWVVPYAQAFAALGVRRAIVVHAAGLDEFAPSGSSRYALLEEGGSISEHATSPAELGLGEHPLEALAIASAAEAAAKLQAALAGEDPAATDALILNSAAALVAAARVQDLAAGVELARELIASGAASAKLELYLRTTQKL